jgi:hypothetical protein
VIAYVLEAVKALSFIKVGWAVGVRVRNVKGDSFDF